MTTETISLVDNVWVKQITLPAGESGTSHSHPFAHQTLLAVGRMEAYIDDQHVRVYDAPAIIYVEAGKSHRFTAITDTTFYCIHALRGSDRVEDILPPGAKPDLAVNLAHGVSNQELFK